MHGNTGPHGGQKEGNRGNIEGESHPTVQLHAVVVQYDERPDRCTVYDRETTGIERTTTWITADASAFVALDEMR